MTEYWSMKPIVKNILVFFSVFAAIITVNYSHFDYEKYQDKILIALFIGIIIDFVIRTVLTFKKYTLIRTKYDIVFQLSNIVLGLLCAMLAIRYWGGLNSFHWVLIIFAFLGLADGIFYKNTIRVIKSSEGLRNCLNFIY